MKLRKQSKGFYKMSKKRDIDIVAKTLYMEARGEGDHGLQAVACVIVNRYRRKKWYSRINNVRSLANVCLKPYQFSCWNKGDQCDTVLPRLNKESEIWKKCVEFATLAYFDYLPDIVGGADHYFACTVKSTPDWAKKMKFVCKIGNHNFYKEV